MDNILDRYQISIKKLTESNKINIIYEEKIQQELHEQPHKITVI